MSYLPDSSLDGGAVVAESLRVMNHDATAPALTLVVSPKLAERDLATIRSLSVGEGWSKVIVEASDCRTRLNGTRRSVGSMRLEAFRHPSGSLRLVVQVSDVDSDWGPYLVGDLLLESYPDSGTETLEDALAMFRVHAGRYADELLEGPHGLKTAAREEARAKKRSQESTNSTVEAILALKVGESFVEEREEWGPLLIPGCAIEPENPQYDAHTYRFVVERKAKDGWGQEFRFTVQVRRGVDGEWEGYDLCMNDDPQDKTPFSRDVRAEGVPAAVNLFRSLLESEAVDLKGSPDVIQEREEYGITDEHLRMGTLSEKSRADLAEECEGLKVAA